MLLRDHLDRVSDAHRQRTAVQNGRRSPLDDRKTDRLDRKADAQAREPTRHELYERQHQRVVPLREAADRDAMVLETLTSFKRAGCSGVLTYHAAHAARLLGA